MSWKAWVVLIATAGFFGIAAAHPVTEDLSVAARRFVEALGPDQKAKAVYPIEARERLDWHYVPRERGGISLKELTPAQRHLATGLLGAVLSQRGLLQATTIMSLEAVLAELEQGRGPVRDAELYYVSVFGEPSEGGTWGWRFEGHHLSLNFLVVKGHLVAVTPSFWGANPAEVRNGPRQGLRALASEDDLGRALLVSLNEEQRRRAVVSSDAPSDIILSPNREAELLTPAGLGAREMNGEQVALLRRLIEAYVRRYRAEVADEELANIERSGIDQLQFAWAGATAPESGQAYYFRVQGPTFVLEFDNAQNQANHIHTVWRNVGRDFGTDALAEHYRSDPH
jgi:hypothetical protein